MDLAGEPKAPSPHCSFPYVACCATLVASSLLTLLSFRQHLRPARNVEGRTREGAGRLLP